MSIAVYYVFAVVAGVFVGEDHLGVHLQPEAFAVAFVQPDEIS